VEILRDPAHLFVQQLLALARPLFLAPQVPQPYCPTEVWTLLRQIPKLIGKADGQRCRAMELALRAESQIVLLEALLFPVARGVPLLRVRGPSRRETINAMSMSSGSQDAGSGCEVSVAEPQDLRRPQLAAGPQIDAFCNPLASAQRRDKDQETSAG